MDRFRTAIERYRRVHNGLTYVSACLKLGGFFTWFKSSLILYVTLIVRACVHSYAFAILLAI